MKNQIKLLSIAIILIVSFSFLGCGKSDEALLTYTNEVNTFSKAIEEKGTALAALDFTDETSSEKALALLDEIGAAFLTFSKLTVPEDYLSVNTLAVDANTYMEKAVELYHQALEGEVYDQEIADEAYLNYKKAMNRISYIGNILEGVAIELKDGDTIVDSSSEE